MRMAALWEPIAEAPGYMVSVRGEILGRRGRLMALCKNRGGYMTVSPYIGGKTIYRQVHRLVAQAFIPNPGGLPVVHHIDGDRANNFAENLEWVSYQENAQRVAHPAANNRRRSRRVVELAVDGTVAREWGTIKSAAIHARVCAATMSGWLKGGKRRYRFADQLDAADGEVWKPARVRGRAVEVSNYGRVRSPSGQIVTGKNRNGYNFYNGKGVHILVALAFLANPDNKPVVAHIDGDPQNNRVSNLEWTTQRACCERAGRRRYRPVRYTDPSGKCWEFESIKAACEATHAYPADIVRACQAGTALAGGRRWAYIKVKPEPADLQVRTENAMDDAALHSALATFGWTLSDYIHHKHR